MSRLTVMSVSRGVLESFSLKKAIRIIESDFEESVKLIRKSLSVEVQQVIKVQRRAEQVKMFETG